MEYTQAGSRGMRVTPIAVAVLLAGLVVFTIAGSASADGIMLNINDVSLKHVITLLTQQSGVNIIIGDDPNLDKHITASLKDVPLQKALDYVVKIAGVSYRRMDDGTYIVGGSPVEELPSITPRDVTPLLVAEPAPVERPRESIVTTIKLIHSTPSELLKLTGWTGNNPIRNGEAQMLERMSGPTQPRITNPGGGLFNSNPYSGVVSPVNAPGAINNNQPVAPTFDPRPDSGAGRTADPYAGAAQVPTTPSRPPGYPPVPGQGTAGRPGTTPTTPTTGGSSGSQGFLWPEGVEQAQPFDLDNSIIVKGDEGGIEKFKKIVRMLDVPPKQVQIKAEFVEVSTTDVKRFGIDWSLQRLNESFQTQFGPVGNVVVGFASGNLTAQLRAQLTTDVGRVINGPIVSTINNQMAYISINQQIPYWTSMNVISGDQSVLQYTPQFITIDTNLMVQPRVNGDNTITMILTPRVADTGAIIVGPDGSSIPETRSQELFTQRRVANGETIVVGGFIRKNDSNSVNKVPILGDLPIIGGLFKTVAKTTEDRELLIFVTPTILPDPTGGTVGTSPSL